MRRAFALLILCVVWASTAVAQSTTVGVKIGNNGNISFNNKYKSGNYTEIYQFGNGYQGGVYLERRLFRGISVRGEMTYVNSSFQMDHDSHWPGEWNGKENYFYEEIVVNTSAFNTSGALVVNIGRVSVAVGPEVSMITQANGRGARYYYADQDYDGKAQRLQYRFFSKRKQVYNQENPDEKFAYNANRISYGMDMNVNVMVYKPFAIQAKVFLPMNDFVEDFTGFQTDQVNQQTINVQLSVVYSFPMILGSGYKAPKKKKRRK